MGNMALTRDNLPSGDPAGLGSTPSFWRSLVPMVIADDDRRASPRLLLADRAYRELRDRLVTLRIAPGSPIDEDVIGRELDMGRTPVREAIKRLALENLVAVFPRRGTFASDINITDLAHISDVRVQLEGHAAYRAAPRITAAHREEPDTLLSD